MEEKDEFEFKADWRADRVIENLSNEMREHGDQLSPDTALWLWKEICVELRLHEADVRDEFKEQRFHPSDRITKLEKKIEWYGEQLQEANEYSNLGRQVLKMPEGSKIEKLVGGRFYRVSVPSVIGWNDYQHENPGLALLELGITPER